MILMRMRRRPGGNKPEGPHSKFVDQAIAKGIKIGDGGREYKEMGLTRRKAIKVEIDRLNFFGIKDARKIAKSNIRKVYGERWFLRILRKLRLKK